MRIGDHIAVARRSLSRHLLRTLLTVLGMIIGVASVITMTSIGMGARHQVSLEIERLGTNMLMVQPAANSTTSRQNDSLYLLREGDAAAIRREIPQVQYAVPGVSGDVRLVTGNRNWQTAVIGTHPDYVAIRDWKITQGRNFTESEVLDSRKVMVIGRTVERRLSPVRSLLGRIIRVDDVPFRVIGVLDEKGYSAIGRDQDDVVLAPISSVKMRLLGGLLREIPHAASYLMIKGNRAEDLPELRLSIEQLLRDRHRIPASNNPGFVVRDPVEALNAQKSASEAMTLLLGCIAAVSLLVGGISIMNIMLVSVTERIREIGVRLAVGATPGNICGQFLAESVILSLLGGTIGLLLGLAFALLIGALMEWAVMVDVWICLGALALSAVVGVVSGLYPALRATRVDPLEAIRQD